jgi:hypothetical protein
MFNGTTSTIFIAQRCQEHKEKNYPISPNLASFAPLRETAIIRFLIFIAPRRQERKEKNYPISPNLASFAPLRLAPWNILSTEALSFHSRHYSTGRVIAFPTP